MQKQSRIKDENDRKMLFVSMVLSLSIQPAYFYRAQKSFATKILEAKMPNFISNTKWIYTS